jgi:hypothetical protein
VDHMRRSELSGAVRLGCSGAVGTEELAELVGRFSRTHPDIDLAIRTCAGRCKPVVLRGGVSRSCSLRSRAARATAPRARNGGPQAGGLLTCSCQWEGAAARIRACRRARPEPLGASAPRGQGRHTFLARHTFSRRDDHPVMYDVIATTEAPTFVYNSNSELCDYFESALRTGKITCFATPKRPAILDCIAICCKRFHNSRYLKKITVGLR